MSTGRWNYRERTPTEPAHNPIQGEFFDEEVRQASRGSLEQGLIREAIQNSLDARDPGAEGPVFIRIFLSGDDSMSESIADFWFHTAWPHLTAPGSGLRNLDSKPPGGRFLVIEDFGTRGLEGDLDAWKIADGANNDFYSFFRAEGLSGKDEGSGGSWGVGKSVFPRCSDCNTFMALTERSSDKRKLLIGKAITNCHSLGGKEFAAYGHFGVESDDPLKPLMPCEDERTIERFRKDFRLHRAPGAPGLSVVVPFASDDITVDKLVNSVVREYFHAIAAHQLEVTIAQARSGKDAVRISATQLDVLIASAGEAGLPAILDLSKWALRGAEMPILPDQSKQIPPTWNILDAASDDDRRRLAESLRNNEPISLRVPVLCHKEGFQSALPSHFDVYIRLDREGGGAAPVFLRNSIRVTAAHQRLRGHNAFVLVVIDHEHLAGLLRDAEPPAHNNWSKETRNFRRKYRFGAELITLVKFAPRTLLDWLMASDQERDYVSLADFFPSPNPSSTGRRGSSKNGKPEEPNVAEAVEQRPRKFQVTRFDSGFSIIRGDAEAADVQRLHVRCAYDVLRGNAFKQYDRLDFRMDRPPIVVDMKGLKSKHVEGNRMILDVEDPNYELTITGFDTNRDLLVDVRDGRRGQPLPPTGDGS